MTRFRLRVLGSLGIAALVGGLAVAAQPVSANDGAATKHVLLISVDGLNPNALKSVQIEHTSALPLEE